MSAIEAVKTQTLVLLAGWLLTASIPGQETNTFSFTNKYGEVTHAVVLRVEPDGIVYKYLTGGTGGGKVSFTNLSAEIRQRFKYDPVSATAFETKQKERRRIQRDQERIKLEQHLQQVAQEKARKAQEERRKQIKASKVLLRGKVFQKTNDGLMVQRPGNPIFPVVLVADFAGADSLGDDSTFEQWAYGIGLYEYTSAMGFKKTILKFTVDPAKVPGW